MVFSFVMTNHRIQENKEEKMKIYVKQIFLSSVIISGVLTGPSDLSSLIMNVYSPEPLL